MLQSYNQRKQIIIVTHFNHPNELTQEARCAIHALIRIGCPVRNQTVLLKGINDDSHELSDLMNRLTSAGVLPYYVFQCDPVAGIVERFGVPLERAKEIEEWCAARVGGLALPRFVADVPGARRKVPLDRL